VPEVDFLITRAYRIKVFNFIVKNVPPLMGTTAESYGLGGSGKTYLQRFAWSKWVHQSYFMRKMKAFRAYYRQGATPSNAVAVPCRHIPDARDESSVHSY
jgi:hypothetical protein